MRVFERLRRRARATAEMKRHFFEIVIAEWLQEMTVEGVPAPQPAVAYRVVPESHDD